MVNLGFEAFLLFFCCSMLMASFVIYLLIQTLLNHPPFVPSRLKNIQLAFDYVQLNGSHNFVDLGSGDGRVAFAAARREAKAAGIEINPYLILYCRLINLFKKNKAQFILGSYFKHDLSSYNVVFTYLYPEVVEQLEAKIFAEIKPNSWVISNTFNFPNRTAVAQFGQVYVYKKS